MSMEYYFSCHAPAASSPEDAITTLHQQFQSNLSERGLDVTSLVLLRFFCSDVYTHAPLVDHLWPSETPCQRVFIGQPPLDSAFLSVQAYCMAGPIEKCLTENGSLSINHGAYQSLWTLDYPPVASSSLAQTDSIIDSLKNKLRCRDMTLERDVIRTWYYVRDVDNNYAGMVKSRVAHYEACGLLPTTHFIASTGIEACAPRPDVLVWLQSHAEKGLQPGQITYLKALDHLSPTHVYAVNFERATHICYGDRAHCRISGTASINHNGEVLYKGDVIRQFERTVENVEALLHEGSMQLKNMKAATIYLRDSHDYPRIASMVQRLLPVDCAINITRGPVCRPDWLVELEGEAISHCPSGFAPFF